MSRPLRSRPAAPSEDPHRPHLGVVVPVNGTNNAPAVPRRSRCRRLRVTVPVTVVVVLDACTDNSAAVGRWFLAAGTRRS